MHPWGCALCRLRLFQVPWHDCGKAGLGLVNAANWQRKQNVANNFSAVLPYDMEQQRKETKEMLDDLTNRDQRMMFGLVTLVHLADTKEQLDSDTETILTVARKHLCQMSTLRWQQKDGLDTVLPYGLRKIRAIRTLTTESTAVLIPFRAQEIMQTGGIYYGQNAVSKNMIVADRRKLLNGNSFRLGVSGSGNPSLPRRRSPASPCPPMTISSSGPRIRIRLPDGSVGRRGDPGVGLFRYPHQCAGHGQSLWG